MKHKKSQLKPELLSPVSDFVSLKAAIDAGCDAVYFGLKELNMRVTAKNFDLFQLPKIVKKCHANKHKEVKAYLALNSIIYNNELERVERIIDQAKRAKVDAIICWDPAVIDKVRKAKIPLHISTQASVSNIDSAKFYKRLGAKRIILARELSLKQIAEIRKKAGIEVECFVHGAMCVSISGRCFMSQFTFGRSANRGDCLQPCRRGYDVYRLKDTEEGFEFELGNNYVMSPKDLCALPFLDKLVSAGIDSFKIEGRARSPEYVKVATECYREAIDACVKREFTQQVRDRLMKKLETVYNRGFSSGFFLGKPIGDWTTPTPNTKATEKKVFVGIVKNYYKKPSVAEIRLQAGSIRIGDTVMFQGPTTGIVEHTITSIEINRKKANEARKGTSPGIKIEGIVRKNDRVFVISKR
ncbi:MAG: U32 family peptidase [Candidatus Woesearchaeota archaeon]|nr:U32 family peptidase [Candidatus Woesearchaeota archaeon]